MSAELTGKPKTYLAVSLVMYGLFIWLPFINLFFLASASLAPALNRAYYSGDLDRARLLSSRARLWLIIGCIFPVTAVCGGIMLFIRVLVGEMG